MAAPAGAWRSKTAAQARAAAQQQPPPASKPVATKPAVKPAVEAVTGGQAVDERMLFVASVLIGYTVRAEVKSGEEWEGIFHALRPAGPDFDVLLRWAKPIPSATKRTPNSWDEEQPAAASGEWQPVRPQPLVTIAAADLVQITATDVRMGAADVGAAGWDDAGGFGTDAAISRARGAWGRERELQRWTPDESEGSHMLHLEDAVGHVERGWDQFAVNEAKFGVRTDYAEELYTTELDPNKSKISMAEAARIAAEIERGDHSSVANIHMLEERGIAIDDSQMDEEDRYGAVVRDAPPPPPMVGGAANGASTAGAAQRPNAWAAGRPRPLMPGAAPSAPIAIDMRREANKLRAQMTGGVKAASPYGTPNAAKRASPLSSPLISDPSKLDALNLNPGVPRVDEQTRREFEQFKAQQAASKGSGPDMFKKQEVQEFKKFSEKIEGKLSRSLGKESSMPAVPPLAAAAAAATAGPPTSPAAAAPAEVPVGGAAATPAAGSEEQPAAAAAAAAAAAGGEAAKKSSGLNPFAKSFSFNPSAKEFKPTFGASASAGAAAAPPPSTAAPPAAEAAPAGGAPAAAAGPGTGASPVGPVGGPGPVTGFRQGPASPARNPMQPAGIPMPDMRPDFRRGPRGEGRDPSEGPPPRDSSFGRGRREESRERGPGSYERARREGRHFEGGPGMRPGEGPPPPPPGKGPGPGMQMFPGMPMGPGMMVGPGGMPMAAPGMVPVMMAPGGQPMFMVRPMGPGQQGMPMPMQMFPGMPGGAPMMMYPAPGGRPMMGPPGMMPPGMMGPGMFPPGAGGPGGKGGDRGDD